MIILESTPRAVMAERHARARAAEGTGGEAQAPRFGNLATLDDTGTPLEFRGRRFTVPPVPWDSAMRIMEAERTIVAAASGHGGPTELRGAFATLFREFHRGARPAGWRRFVPRWLRRNPFRHATQAELGEVAAVFSIARTISTVHGVPALQ